MCDYVYSIHKACLELAKTSDSFDMLQIRDKTRELVGPLTHVIFQDCKFEALAFFERGGLPGFVLTTKLIELDTTDHETEEKSVFVFLRAESLVLSVLSQQLQSSDSSN